MPKVQTDPDDIVPYVLIVLLSIVIVCGVLYPPWDGKGSPPSQGDTVHSYVGDTIILNGERRVIVDYDIWRESFFLDNGVRVSFKYVNKNL